MKTLMKTSKAGPWELAEGEVVLLHNQCSVRSEVTTLAFGEAYLTTTRFLWTAHKLSRLLSPIYGGPPSIEIGLSDISYVRREWYLFWRYLRIQAGHQWYRLILRSNFLSFDALEVTSLWHRRMEELLQQGSSMTSGNP